MEDRSNDKKISGFREDRFTWEPGDVEVFDNFGEMLRDCEKTGRKFVKAQYLKDVGGPKKTNKD